jgi:hypothetical protein
MRTRKQVLLDEYGSFADRRTTRLDVRCLPADS